MTGHLITALIIGVTCAVYLVGCCLIGFVLGADTRLRDATRREHEATHQAAYDKRIQALRNERGMR